MSELGLPPSHTLYRRGNLYPRTKNALKIFLMLLWLLSLIGCYAATIQTHISGSFKESSPEEILKNEYIKDVAETQVALNIWGTLHHTGYPLFVILGNLFTRAFRLAGIEPATAASWYALAWGLVILGGFGALIMRLTGTMSLAVLGVVLLGVTRSIWIHNVIAEVYSMSLAIMVLMWVVALWPKRGKMREHGRQRILWLALLGGIGVAHHRAVVFVAPGLIFAVWPDLWAARRHWKKLLPAALGLILLGFLPYLYLPLRARQHAAWVYGEPETLRGFWIEFSGKEADRLVQLPANLAGLWHNVTSVWAILVQELTLPGLLVGLVGLALALIVAPHRRAAQTLTLSAIGPTLFTMFYHTAVLPEAILMPTVLALVFGVVLLVDWIAQHRSRARYYLALAGLVVWVLFLVGRHYDYIHQLVTEPSGEKTITRLKRLPHNGTTAVMLPWGPRYAAAVYSQLVTGENRDMVLVDHKGDYRQLLAEGYQLYTEPETFYTYPPPWQTSFGAASNWWTERLGALYLTSAAPGYVQVSNTPWLAGPDDQSGMLITKGITRRDVWLTCADGNIYLHIIWSAARRPTSDLSIFVHLLGETIGTEDALVVGNADTRHPVYGLYPFTQWAPGAVVRDDFTLNCTPDSAQVRLGLYEQDATGQFINYGELTLPLTDCVPVDD